MQDDEMRAARWTADCHRFLANATKAILDGVFILFKLLEIKLLHYFSKVTKLSKYELE
jgi:hypothetical protein